MIVIDLLMSITLSLSNPKRLCTWTELSNVENVTICSADEADDFVSKPCCLKPYSKGFNLKGRLRKGFVLEAALLDASANVICSPVSALLPLGKLALGAEAPTVQELYQTIGVSTHKDIYRFKKLITDLQYLPGVELTIASRIYVSDLAKIKKKFEQEATDVFQAGIKTTSFSNSVKAANEINSWVSRETKGMIPKLIDPGQITGSSSLVIVNAIHFKGKWQNSFDTAGIKSANFYAPTGTKRVNMLNREGWYKYVESEALNAQIINIPYEKRKSSFIIVLPFDKSGLPTLLNKLKLNPKLVDLSLVTAVERRVNLTIPKFKIISSLDLKDLYYKIGMRHIFGINTGLTGIVEKDELQISSAIQKAVIEVHENGIEASASSGVMMIAMSGMTPMKPFEFKADHPFLYYVQANNEQLFGGIFSEP